MKRKKLYYIPGLISIIGLPVLFFFLGPEDRVDPTCLSLRIPSENRSPGTIIQWSKADAYSVLNKKKFVTIDLDDHQPWYGSDWDEMDINYIFRRKLEFFRKELERLQFTNDTSTILKVRLGEDNTYGEFVWVLNHGMLYRIKRYVYLDNCIYFFSNPPLQHYPPETLDLSVDTSIVVPPGKEPTAWEVFKRNMDDELQVISYMVRRSYILIIGFLLLIIIPSLRGIWKNRRAAGHNYFVDGGADALR
jgi:hypothetical protein